MKKKELWLFLIKLIPLSLALGYLWFAYLQTRYPDILEPLAAPLFALTGVRKWWLVLMLEHYTSVVPYVALVLSTPGIIRRWKRSVVAMIGGLVVIMLGHLLMSVAIYHIMEQFAKTKTSYILLVPIYLINDILPLLLWLAFFGPALAELFGFRRDARTND